MEGLSATVEFSALGGFGRAPTSWEALSAESQAFAEARSTAVAAAAAMLTARGPSPPTFSPALGASSELLALARQAAARIAESHPSGAPGAVRSGETRAGDTVFARLYAAQVSEPGLAELAEDIGVAIASCGAPSGAPTAARGSPSPPPPPPPAQTSLLPPTMGTVVASKLAELVRERGEEANALQAAANLLQRISTVGGSGV